MGEGQEKGGKDGGGKGPLVFHGQCYWCGVWGHSQQRCRQKQQFEQDQHYQKQDPNESRSANSVESAEHLPTPAESNLANLEQRSTKTAPWRMLCSLERNCFAPLAEAEESDVEYYHEQFPTPSEQVTSSGKGKKTRRSRLKAGPACDQCEEELGELRLAEKLEVSQVESSSEAEHIVELTIDSGAAENVMGMDVVPEVPLKSSAGSRAGVEYLAANGTRMPNRGEKAVPIVTSEGQRCMLNMQVTDVRRPLMSVSRICDAGHRVVFEADGGYIEQVDTAERTRFQRVANVYRLQVALDPEMKRQQGFRRQG